eukprot:2088449-Pyramimonas_sp.AAC.1
MAARIICSGEGGAMTFGGPPLATKRRGARHGARARARGVPEKLLGAWRLAHWSRSAGAWERP